MIRLTVLYNLGPDMNEDEFLEWRLGEHQEYNSSIEGVVHTDFGRVYEGWPRGEKAPYRFMTIADFPDRETFEKSFYDDEAQAKLKEDMQGMGDFVFLVSEILATTD